MHLMGGLTAEEYDRTYSDWQLVRRITAYFRPQRGKVVLVALMVTFISLASTVTPIVISRGINLLTGNPPLQVLIGLAALVTIMGALAWGFNFVSLWFSARAVGDVVLQLRADAFAAVVRGGPSFFDPLASGRLVRRLSS